MLTLYYKPTCPFCQKVLATIEELSISVTLKDVSADEALREELIAHGGKRQVPYLVDESRDTALYESDEIIAYLEQHYGGATPLAMDTGTTRHEKETDTTTYGDSADGGGE